MTKQEQIEQMAKIIDDRLIEANLWLGSMNKGKGYWIAEKLVEYYQPKLPIDSVVLLKEEYEKLKSLYDSHKDIYMISNIGNLPLTVESLRRAVNEITELDKTRSELLELNDKYCEEIKELNNLLKCEERDDFKYTIKLPCLPGSTIYALTFNTREPCLKCKHDHSGFTCNCDLDYYEGPKPEDIFKDTSICPKFKLSIIETTFNTNYYLNIIDYFNKTWFLTKEEAEAQLKKVKAILKERNEKEHFIEKELFLQEHPPKKLPWDKD